MTRLAAAALLLLLAPAAAAQTRLGIELLASASSALVRDSITTPLTLRPGPAPGLRLTLETRLDRAWQAGVGLSVQRSRLREHVAGGRRDLLTLTAWQAAVTLRRRLSATVSAWGAIGALAYRPGQTAGTLFAAGAPVVPVAGLGLGLEHHLPPGLTLTLDAGYDAHRFSTTTLRQQGFGGEQLVHRLVLLLGVRRTW